MSFDEAEKFLTEAFKKSKSIKEKTLKGQEQKIIEKPHCVLVVKREPKKQIVVTVLPEVEDENIDEFEMRTILENAIDPIASINFRRRKKRRRK